MPPSHGSPIKVIRGRALITVSRSWPRTATPTTLRERDTLARQTPALVAFLFGLVHGLGFAGALREIGLPQNHLPLARFTFNVGVELGQLLMVLAAYLAPRAPLPRPWLLRARRPALYAVGVVAAYWSWQRLTAIVS